MSIRNGRNLLAQRHLNHNAFSEQTPEADFWAGFIAADGCISKKRELVFGLQAKDADFLCLFRSWVGSGHKVGLYKNSVRLQFRSDQMVKDLLHHYNIGPRKSLISVPPNRRSMEFIAGYWAGDGWLYFDGRQWRCGFIGTKEICEWVAIHFNDLGSPGIRHARNTLHNVYTLHFGGNNLVPLVMGRIADATVFWLDRKRQVYDTMLATINTGPILSNTSGATGVSWNKQSKHWHSYLNLSGRRVFSKFFRDKQDAIDARKAAEMEYAVCQ